VPKKSMEAGEGGVLQTRKDIVRGLPSQSQAGGDSPSLHHKRAGHLAGLLTYTIVLVSKEPQSKLPEGGKAGLKVTLAARKRDKGPYQVAGHQVKGTKTRSPHKVARLTLNQKPNHI